VAYFPARKRQLRSLSVVCSDTKPPVMGRRFATTLAAVTAVGATSLDSSPALANDAPCAGWQIEYLLHARVKISDTTLGAGDGLFPNGPGKLVLRFEDRGGQPGGKVKLSEYEMKDDFTVVSHALLWQASVTADAVTRTTPDSCGVVAQGVLEGRSLRWSGTWSGMRTDGSLICSGALCGKFGAPPAGRSALHIAPHPVSFTPFEYAPDLKSFHTGYSLVSQQTSPSQTSRIALSGREVQRSCVPIPACP
jgi:hypothetical protein